MAILYRATITGIGPEAPDLVSGGVLILFAEGAPPELAEISVLCRQTAAPSERPPPAGAELRVGSAATRITAIGDRAWAKVAELGHVVIHFDGATATARAGEMSAAPIAVEPLLTQLAVGSEIVISA